MGPIEKINSISPKFFKLNKSASIKVPALLRKFSEHIPVHKDSCLETFKICDSTVGTDFIIPKTVDIVNFSVAVETLTKLPPALPPIVGDILSKTLTVKMISLLDQGGTKEIPVLVHEKFAPVPGGEIALYIDGIDMTYHIGVSSAKDIDKTPDEHQVRMLNGQPVSPGYRYGSAYIWESWKKDPISLR